MITTDHSLKKFDILDRTIAYDGYFKIVRYKLRHTLFAGGWSGEMVREVFERGHAVAVLPYDAVLDQVVMVEQFRVGVIGHKSNNPWIWEIIAGIIEKDETPLDVAHREAQEEAGCTVSDLVQVYDYFVSPGGATETMILFCGRVDASKIGGLHGLAHEHEDIQVHVIPFTTAMERLQTGSICSAPAMIALQWLALHRDELRQKWGKPPA